MFERGREFRRIRENKEKERIKEIFQKNGIEPDDRLIGILSQSNKNINKLIRNEGGNE